MMMGMPRGSSFVLNVLPEHHHRHCRILSADQIRQLPDIKERVARYHAQERAFEAMIRENAHLEGSVLVIDLMQVADPKAGNRFREYAMFPEANISLRIFWGKLREKVIFTCGHSILNRSSTVNVGQLMLQYGGGGHTRVGSCQVPVEDWLRVRDELLEAMAGAGERVV